MKCAQLINKLPSLISNAPNVISEYTLQMKHIRTKNKYSERPSLIEVDRKFCSRQMAWQWNFKSYQVSLHWIVYH